MKYLALNFILYISLLSIITSKQGIHVDGNKLLDGKNEEFIFRGVNLPHAWFTDKTESSIKDISSLGANSARIVLATGTLYPKTTSDQVENIIIWCKKADLICVLEVHDFTGSDNPNDITDISVKYWTELKNILNDNKDYIIVNIANEWEGSWDKGSLWADTLLLQLNK